VIKTSDVQNSLAEVFTLQNTGVESI